MEEKKEKTQSSLRTRLHTWWSNQKRTRKDDLQKDNIFKKEKYKAKLSDEGIGAQIESMRRVN